MGAYRHLMPEHPLIERQPQGQVQLGEGAGGEWFRKLVKLRTHTKVGDVLTAAIGSQLRSNHLEICLKYGELLKLQKWAHLNNDETNQGAVFEVLAVPDCH